MKKLFAAILFISSALTIYAQSTAMDWTRTECGTTKEHHLYAELDSGYVVIIDFVMMNCPSCVYATDRINEVFAPFVASDPGRVKFYSIGFNNLTTCPQMLNWKSYNGYKHEVFEKGADETNYYGGMGMPTVVVLGGGTAHKVYYNNFGYNASQDPKVKAAIEQALAESNVSATSNPSSINRLNIFPNPFTEGFNVELDGRAITHVLVSDAFGRELSRQTLSSNNLPTCLDIPAIELPSGVFFVSVYNGLQLVAVNKVVKE